MYQHVSYLAFLTSILKSLRTQLNYKSLVTGPETFRVRVILDMSCTRQMEQQVSLSKHQKLVKETAIHTRETNPVCQ